MLEIENLDVYYGRNQALFGVTLEVQDGEIVSILGRNGAGKSTLLKSIIGLAKTSKGSIKFDGNILSALSPEKISRSGVAYVPDYKGLFPYLTAKENLQVSAIGSGNPKRSYDFILEYFPQLKPLLDRQADTLSGGEQQQLTIARSLMREAKLVLLDEPTQGMSPNVIEAFKKLILNLNEERGTAFLLVEQEIEFATDVSKRVYGMLTGSICYEGTPEHFYETKAYEKFLVVSP